MEHAALIPCQLDQLAECRGSRSVVARGSVLAWRNTALKFIAMRASHFRALPIEDAAYVYRVAGPFAELPAARKVKRLITNCCVDEMFSHQQRRGQRMPFGRGDRGEGACRWRKRHRCQVPIDAR